MKSLFILCIFILTMLVITNCDAPIETTPIVTKKEYSFKWNDSFIMSKKAYGGKYIVDDIKKNNKEYSKYLVEQIKTSGLLSAELSDIKEFGYKDGMDKLQFWGNLLVETMWWESGWNKDTGFQESFSDVNGTKIISRGMFQISIESSNNRSRSDCKLKLASELHDAKKNIWCGVRVISWYIKDSGRIAGKVNGKWKGAARYFSVFRGTLDYTKTALSAIKAANN